MLLKVERMTCGHCVRSVTEAVRTVNPEAVVDVSLADGTVRVAGDLSAEAAAKAIREQGYTVQVTEA
jgi:copper chaperone